MFNNANVLYKTRFVDGVSTIARYSQIKNERKKERRRESAKKRKITENGELSDIGPAKMRIPILAQV